MKLFEITDDLSLEDRLARMEMFVDRMISATEKLPPLKNNQDVLETNIAIEDRQTV